MIIVEGPDNAGKTTLCNALAIEMKKSVVHSPNHKDMLGDTDNWYLWILKSLAAADNPDIIYDRHPLISEQVYGPLLRDKNVFSEGVGLVLYEAFLRKSPLIIFCCPPTDRITDFGSREQLEGVKENALGMVTRYRSFIHELFHHELYQGDVIKYDYTSCPIERILEEIREYEDEAPSS